MPGNRTAGERRRSGPGRPRSERSRAAILHAAADLLGTVGFVALSVDAIAARAGVSKATVYRWWPNKAAVVMDAFLDATGPLMPFPDTGDVEQDLRNHLRAVIGLFTEPATRRPWVALIAQSQHDPTLADALRERFIGARRDGARQLLTRGVALGQLRADLDLDLAIDALYGPLYYRLLISADPLTPDYADRVVRLLGGGMRSPKAG